MSRCAMVIDLDHCTGCKGCEIACKNENKIALGERFNRVLLCGPYGTLPNLSQYYLPLMCQQCQDAPCLNVCPTGATYRADDGTVQINQDVCIGCQICLDACPYGVRDINVEKNVAEKCTLCSHLTEHGEDPFCVQACSVQCRFYGDLDDPESPASKAIAAKPEAAHTLLDEGNAPSVVYLLSEKYCSWHEDGDATGHNTNEWAGTSSVRRS